ncbi:carbamoyl-phosphate synthase (glutamine-hydrolyzing) cpa2, partial [Ascosphaera acerosa]
SVACAALRTASTLAAAPCNGSFRAVGSVTASLNLPRSIGSTWAPAQRQAAIRPARPFSTICRRMAAAEQPPPNAEAYLASGAIKGSGNLVDVKKVLVIGSGGLSIGQAGEFDYSGMLRRKRGKRGWWWLAV